jgi:rubrerythrin
MNKTEHNNISKKLTACIASECRAIQFYTQNLQELNYSENKQEVQALLLDSIKHTELLAKLMLEIIECTPTTITKEIREEAEREELGMREIYEYTLKNSSDKSVHKTLRLLADWEDKHQKLVLALR